MKHALFTDLIGSLTRKMIANSEFYLVLQTIGVDPSQWPYCKTREIAEGYVHLRQENNHEYAAFHTADLVRSLPRYDETPSDPNILRGFYFDELENYRVYRLAQAMRDAENIEEMKRALAGFNGSKPIGVDLHDFFELVPKVITENMAAVAEKRAIITIPEWTSLTSMIGGLNPGRVCLLVGQTGFGKTQLALNLARSCARHAPTIFVNMEMITHDIAERILQGELGMTISMLKHGHFDIERLRSMTDKFEVSKLYVTEGTALTMEQIFAIAHLGKKRGMQFMFIDYDQKIELKTSRHIPEWKALQIAVGDLEELAKDLGVWICLMAQSNDDGDPSGSKRSKYSASTVLRFYKDAEHRNVVQAVKNRFGRHNAAVEVEYKPEIARITELRMVSDEMAKPKIPKFVSGVAKYDPSGY